MGMIQYLQTYPALVRTASFPGPPARQELVEKFSYPSRISTCLRPPEHIEGFYQHSQLCRTKTFIIEDIWIIIIITVIVVIIIIIIVQQVHLL